MSRSERSLLREQIRSLLRADGRFVDMGAQLRVWRCTCGVAHREYARGGSRHGQRHEGEAAPAELLPTVYGGRYDRLLRRYVGVPEQVREMKCHPGQVEVLTMDTTGILRVLALGSPGAGKTFAAVTRSLLMALARPNSTGGLIAPTNDRRQILWQAFLELVEPAGWLEDVSTTRKEITLVNRVIVQILAAKSSSKQYGNPLQGRSFDWAVVDESQNVDDEAHVEIAARGRRASKTFVIIETATNAQVPAFRVRLEHFKTNAQYRRINFTGYENPWIAPEWWERLRGDMSEREFREKVLAEDVPAEMLVYPRFQLAKTVAPRGVVPAWVSDIQRRQWGKLRDVTEQLTYERFGRAAKYIIAQDFGVLVNAAEVLKAYRAANGDLLWWVIDEVTSGGATDIHARKLLQYYDSDDVLVVADPHFNSKEADKSDYNIMRGEGLDVRPAATGTISKKHRIAMVNALLEDATGRRRLFIDCDANGTPRCRMLTRSFLTSQYNDHGEPEKERKAGLSDPSHWTSAVGFGVFPWERTTSGGSVEYVGPGAFQKRRWDAD